MKRKYLTLALVALLLQTFIGIPAATAAKTQAESEAQLMEGVKVKVARLGIGDKARVTVKFKDGSKLKGYISQARDAEFVVRDHKTDAPTVVLYRDVARVESNRRHSTAKNAAISGAIGAGVFLGLLAMVAALIDD
jgi:hypothetical protein